MSNLRVALLGSLILSGCSPASEDSDSVEANGSVAVDVAATEVNEPAETDAPPAVAQATSNFTKLDMAQCRIVEENKEEGPYWLRRCSGHAGWQLDWSESDLRQGLTLISPGGQQTELRLSDRVAKGAFNSLGTTVEWRGADAAKPEALIVRMNVASGAEPTRPDISRLAVVRLTGTPCLAAVIQPGPGQNEKARGIADGAMADCVDG